MAVATSKKFIISNPFWGMVLEKTGGLGSCFSQNQRGNLAVRPERMKAEGKKRDVTRMAAAIFDLPQPGAGPAIPEGAWNSLREDLDPPE